MTGPVRVIWDDAAVDEWIARSPQCEAMMAALTARVTTVMKAAIPVSQAPSAPAATPGRSQPPAHSPGYLRSSVRSWRLPDGDVIIGPTAPYAAFVDQGTSAHVISSKGPWPLRNRQTGAVFGRTVRHPGTRPVHFVQIAADSVAGMVLHA